MADTQIVEQDLRPVAYRFHETKLVCDFPVYETRVSAWWMDGGTKLSLFFSAIKQGSTIEQACYLAGISKMQYKHFHRLHPWFVPLVKMYRHILPLKLKTIFLEKALGNKEAGIAPDAEAARKAFSALGGDRKDDSTVTDEEMDIPPGGSHTRLVDEAILSADGKIVMRKRTAQLTQHGNGGTE